MIRIALAASAAIGLAFVTIPLADVEPPEPSGFAAGAPAFCDGKNRTADLSFTLKDMNGRDLRMSDYKGKVILLNFWATWCGPCKYEIPEFVTLYSKYKEQGFVVLGVSTDDPPDKLRAFAQQYKMNYPVLVGRDREDLVDEAYGPMWGIPVSFLITRGGTICRKQMGLPQKDEFEKQIKVLLST
jgi:peroxiredoxin